MAVSSSFVFILFFSRIFFSFLFMSDITISRVCFLLCIRLCILLYSIGVYLFCVSDCTWCLLWWCFLHFVSFLVYFLAIFHLQLVYALICIWSLYFAHMVVCSYSILLCRTHLRCTFCLFCSSIAHVSAPLCNLSVPVF